MDNYEEQDAETGLTWDEFAIFIAALGIVEKDESTGKSSSGFSPDLIRRLAAKMLINVTSIDEYVTLLQFADNGTKVTDVKIAGSPVPVPAAHSLVLNEDGNTKHVVLVTSR